jgi:hypothetical protein
MLAAQLRAQPERVKMRRISTITVTDTYPLVEKEWKRLRVRLRRHGGQETCKHMVHLIEAGGYPLALILRLAEHFLKHRDYLNAGKLIEAVSRAGIKNPLLEELHSSWLWCIGKRRLALSAAAKSARQWRKSYLFRHAAALYSLMTKRTRRAYHHRRADHYWKLAASAAIEEESRRSSSLMPPGI